MTWFKHLQRWLQPAPEFTENWVRCPDSHGSHRMAYTDWGDRDNPRVLLCVHGLTRNGRDFDYLARALSRQYRVICPDVVGRGKSAWLSDKNAYGIPQYAADMLVLLARLNVEQVDWVGTSMGGLIGMTLAAQADSPIRRMVLNDVGPVITRVSLQRIASYVGKDQSWDSFEAAEAYFKTVCAPFGNLNDTQWRQLTQYSFVQGVEGRWHFGYDMEIGLPFRAAHLFQDMDLWPLYEAIRCPVLAVRGADSDLLTRDVWLAMGERGPKAQLAEVPEVGHAPTFMPESQIRLVRDYLLG